MTSLRTALLWLAVVLPVLASAQPGPAPSRPALAPLPPVPADANWDDRFILSGLDGPVHTVAMEGDEVYLGGRFETAGGVLARNIVMWNRRTRTFEPLKGGIYGDTGTMYHEVNGIAVDADYVYVGGVFSFADGSTARHLARYHKATGAWSALGNFTQQDRVGALAMVEGHLFVAVQASNTYTLRRWDPATETWAVYDPGLGYDPVLQINTLRVHEGAIYVGGSFMVEGRRTCINRFDLATRTFASFPDGEAVCEGVVNALAFDESTLYAAGTFTNPEGEARSEVRTWDGTAWQGLGRTFTQPGQNGYGRPVMAPGLIEHLAVHPDGSVYAAGQFTQIGGVEASDFVVWDGTAWDDVFPEGRHHRVRHLIVHDEALWVGMDTYSLPEVFASGGAYLEAGTWHALVDGPRLGLPDGGERMFEMGGDLYVLGDHRAAGTGARFTVARWTGRDWEPVALRFPDGFTVQSVVAYKGQVHFGGFTYVQHNGWTAQGGTLAFWDGESDAVIPYETSFQGYGIRALQVVNDTLYAAGVIRHVGYRKGEVDYEVAARNVVYFDPVQQHWHALGEGVGSELLSEGVHTMLAWDHGEGLELYAGGHFSEVDGAPAASFARYKNGRWEPLGRLEIDSNGTMYPGVVQALVHSERHLYLGGTFDRVDGMPAGSVARFDLTTQQLEPLGEGVQHRFHTTQAGTVKTMEARFNGDLYVGGNFTYAGGQPARHVALWNAERSAWEALGTGVESTYQYEGSTDSYASVNDLHLLGATVLVTGAFNRAGGKPAFGFATWSATWLADQHWEGAFGKALLHDFLDDGDYVHKDGRPSYGYVSDFAVDGERLYVAGQFDAVGAVSSADVAVFDRGTETWQGLGEGVERRVEATPGGYRYETADAKVVHLARGKVWLGGDFERVGGVTVNNVAVWDGQHWAGLGGGVNGIVRDLVVVGEYVYVAGQFSQATNPNGSTVEALGLVRWDIGAQVWQRIGTLQPLHPDYALLTWGWALAVQGNDVYVGGLFGGVDQVEGSGVLRYDHAAGTWHPLGAGLWSGGVAGGEVRAMTFLPDGDLIVAGLFDAAGEAQTTVNSVARWDGTAWHPLGGGVLDETLSGGAFTAGSVEGVIAVGPEIYVSGGFTHAVQREGHRVAARGKARWTPYTGWSSLGSTTNGRGDPALAVVEDHLYVGGQFDRAGDKLTGPVARWQLEAPATPMANVQFVHNAAGLHDLRIDLYADGRLIANDVTYPAATAYIPLPANQPITFAIAPYYSESADEAMFTYTETLAPRSYVVTAVGVLSTYAYQRNPDNRPIDLSTVPKAVTPSPTGPVAAASPVTVFVVHGVTDAPSLRIVDFNSGTEMASNLGFGEAGALIELEPGLHRIEVYRASDEVLLRSFQVDLAGSAGAIYPLQLGGFLDPSQNQDGPALTLFSVTPGGEAEVLPDTTPNEEDSRLPTAFALYPNAPNPVAGAGTVIGYDLAQAVSVRLDVFDALGRRVAVLVDETQPAGRYHVPFRSQGLASGVYVYRLSTSTFTATRQMVVLNGR